METSGLVRFGAGARRRLEAGRTRQPEQRVEGDGNDHCPRNLTADAVCVGENETLADATRKLRDLDVGSMPICGDDERLNGLLTDRDIVLLGSPKGSIREGQPRRSWPKVSPSRSAPMTT